MEGVGGANDRIVQNYGNFSRLSSNLTLRPNWYIKAMGIGKAIFRPGKSSVRWMKYLAPFA